MVINSKLSNEKKLKTIYKTSVSAQSIDILMTDLKRAEERAEEEGWIDADDLEKELEEFQL